MDSPREFKFDFTAEDYARFNLDHEARSRGLLRATLVLGAVLTAAVLAPAGIYVVRSSEPAAALGRAWPAPLFLALFWSFLLRGRSAAVRRAAESMVRNPDGGHRLIGPRRVVVGPAGVRHEQEAQAIELDWKAFVRGARGPGHLYLYFSPVQAVVLPRRCFSSDEDFDDFAAFVEARIAPERSGA